MLPARTFFALSQPPKCTEGLNICRLSSTLFPHTHALTAWEIPLFLLLFLSSSPYPLSYSSLGAFQVLLGTTTVDQGHALPPLPPFCPFFARPFPLSSFSSSYPLPPTLSPTHPRVRSKSFWVPLLWTKDTHSLLFLHSLSCVQVLLVTTTVDQGHA